MVQLLLIGFSCKKKDESQDLELFRALSHDDGYQNLSNDFWESIPFDEGDAYKIISLEKSGGFYAIGPTHNIQFKSNGLIFSYLDQKIHMDAAEQDSKSFETSKILIHFDGADSSAEGHALAPVRLPTQIFSHGGVINEVTGYNALRFANVYEKIDLLYLDSGESFSFVFVVNPGGDPDQIKINIEGGEDVNIDENGRIVVRKRGGVFEISQPYSFQVNDENHHQKVVSSFSLSDSSSELALAESSPSVNFDLGQFQGNLPLVIDPTLSFVTLLGNKTSTKIAVGSGAESIIIGGPSADLDDQSGVFYIGRHDSEDGSLLRHILIFGGDRAVLRDIYAQGNSVYLTGETQGNFLTGFNSVPAPLQPEFGGRRDGFVLVLDSNSLNPYYGTYLGGSGDDVAMGVRSDGQGNIYVVGHSSSADFPHLSEVATPSLFDVFSLKFMPDVGGGNDLSYGKLLGGSLQENAIDISIDNLGNLYVAGRTNSSDLRLQAHIPAAFDPAVPGFHPFVAKYSSSGELIFSSYVHDGDVVNGVLAFGMDVSENGHQIGLGGTYFSENSTLHGYIAKLGFSAEAGTYKLAYTVKPEGSSPTVVHDVELDSLGNLYAVGETDGEGFVSTESTSGLDAISAFLMIFKDNSGGADILFSKMFGGSQVDRATNIYVDQQSHEIYIVGSSNSNPFVGISNEDSNDNNMSLGFLKKYEAIISPVPPNEPPQAVLAQISDVVLNDVLFKFTPQALQLGANGKWVSAHIALDPEAFASIEIDASQSSDPENDNLSYEIELSGPFGAVSIQNKSYSAELLPGGYNVFLTVCDPEGLCDTAEQSFSVSKPELDLVMIDQLTLNGLYATSIEIEGDSLHAKFPRRGIEDTLEIGESVPVALGGIFQAVDYIKVMEQKNQKKEKSKKVSK